MTPADPAPLLLVTFLGVALVVLLITWLRMPAFIALAVGSLFVGLAARMPLADIPRAFQQGVGDTLGFIAMVIGLGTVIGKLLAESGGAVVVSQALVRALGERRLDWALLLSGFIIGLPVFFQVGLVLLAPVLFTLHAADAATPLLRLGIPLVAGLSAAHGLVPPHPGPLAAIERLGADPGRTLFYSLIVGLPVAMISGPLFGRFISRRVHVDAGAMADQLTGSTAAARMPSLGVTLLTILLPVLLMLLASLAQAVAAGRQRCADGSCSRAARSWRCCSRRSSRSTRSARRAASTAPACCGSRKNRCRRSPACSSSSAPAAGSAACSTSRAPTRPSRRRWAACSSRRSCSAWVIAALLRLSVGSATVAVRDRRQHHGADGHRDAARRTRSCWSSRSAPGRSSPRT